MHPSLKWPSLYVQVKDARSESLYPYNCKMLSILNKLTLKKELQHFVIYNVFLDKK